MILQIHVSVYTTHSHILGLLVAGALVSALPRPGPGPVASPGPRPSPFAAPQPGPSPLPRPGPGPSYGYAPLAEVGNGCFGCYAGYDGYGYGGYDFKWLGQGYGYAGYLQYPFFGY